MPNEQATFCPLIKDDCKKAECMFWMRNELQPNKGACAIIETPRRIKELSETIAKRPNP